jgi:hypothetical protein
VDVLIVVEAVLLKCEFVRVVDVLVVKAVLCELCVRAAAIG